MYGSFVIFLIIYVAKKNSLINSHSTNTLVTLVAIDLLIESFLSFGLVSSVIYGIQWILSQLGIILMMLVKYNMGWVRRRYFPELPGFRFTSSNINQYLGVLGSMVNGNISWVLFPIVVAFFYSNWSYLLLYCMTFLLSYLYFKNNVDNVVNADELSVRNADIVITIYSFFRKIQFFISLFTAIVNAILPLIYWLFLIILIFLLVRPRA
jgi:hypothetical protein